MAKSPIEDRRIWDRDPNWIHNTANKAEDIFYYRSLMGNPAISPDLFVVRVTPKGKNQ